MGDISGHSNEATMEGQLRGRPRPAWTRNTLLRLGIINVNGGGIRVVLSKNDSQSSKSIVKTVLTCKKEDSQFKRKFRGFKHESTIRINGVEWGCYSYLWKKSLVTPGLRAAQLAELFKNTPQVLQDADGQYEGSNIRCHVEVLSEEPVAMDAMYSEADITTHCTSDDTRFAVWREHHMPFTQGDAYFFGDTSHKSLKETIHGVQTKYDAAPTISGGITF